MIVTSVSISNFSAMIRSSLVFVEIFTAVLIATSSLINFPAAAAADFVSFNESYLPIAGGDNGHFRELDDGQTVQLLLDQTSASGFGSQNKYLFGNISINIKLVPQDSAGTVTTFYTSSETSNHDELDFEFLGNSSGEPYVLQTNVYANGVGQREQRIYLWFDPTADFHTYSLLWNEQQVIFQVDGIPIRMFKNNEAIGLAYPSSQAMRIFSTLWDGDSWATQGGFVKINWAHSPFIATYQNFSIDACQWIDSSSQCPSPNSWWSGTTLNTMGAQAQNQLKWVQQNYMIYNYCTDTERFPTAPAECNVGN